MRSPGPRAGRLHKVIPELLEVVDPQENVTRGIGLYSLKENGYKINFSPNVKIEVKKTRRGDEEATRVEYHTPKGVVSTKEVINEEMRNAGVSITWVQEHGIKRLEDYEIWAYHLREHHRGPGLRSLPGLADSASATTASP